MAGWVNLWIGDRVVTGSIPGSENSLSPPHPLSFHFHGGNLRRGGIGCGVCTMCVCVCVCGGGGVRVCVCARARAWVRAVRANSFFKP